jgi:hypothetical protein
MRRKQLLDDLERIEYRTLKGESLDGTVWTGLGRGYGPVVKETRELINDSFN